MPIALTFRDIYYDLNPCGSQSHVKPRITVNIYNQYNVHVTVSLKALKRRSGDAIGI